MSRPADGGMLNGIFSGTGNGGWVHCAWVTCGKNSYYVEETPPGDETEPYISGIESAVMYHGVLGVAVAYSSVKEGFIWEDYYMFRDGWSLRLRG